MIEWAGLGVAMQNAVPEVKLLMVTPMTNDEEESPGQLKICTEGELKYGIIWPFIWENRRTKIEDVVKEALENIDLSDIIDKTRHWIKMLEVGQN